MNTPSLAEDREYQAKAKLAESVFLDSNEYHTFNNVPVQTGFRTVLIDHVIVSRFGIFVIETSNKNGGIYGNWSDRQWTQIIGTRKSKFPNPLRQSFLDTQNLGKLLGISSEKLHSAIVFWGNCEFRTIMPLNVLNNKLTGFIKSKKKTILTEAEVALVCNHLTRLKEPSGKDYSHATKVFLSWLGKN